MGKFIMKVLLISSPVSIPEIENLTRLHSLGLGGVAGMKASSMLK